jgi:hypothetical protein
MFGLFRSSEQKSTEKFWKSTTGQRLTALNDQYFGPGAVWADFSPETKQKILGWLLDRISGIFAAENQFAQMRLELAAMTYVHAQLVVLLKDPVNDYNRSRYISGKLHPHIRACAPHCNELAEELWRMPNSTDADLYLYAQQRSIYYNYVLNGIHQLRYEFEDLTDGNRDWLRPFSKSMMIWQEDQYRSKIGLATLFENKIIRAIPHSTFFNLVRDGVRNPLFEWERTYGSHDATS